MGTSQDSNMQILHIAPGILARSISDEALAQLHDPNERGAP
jgi:hypothetical protein